MEEKLEKRIIRGEESDIWFYYTKNGRKYSILNCGELMKTSPTFQEMKEAGLFVGWEAIRMNAKDELQTEEITRDNSWEELKERL